MPYRWGRARVRFWKEAYEDLSVDAQGCWWEGEERALMRCWSTLPQASLTKEMGIAGPD
jgi:hypothetical protein